MEAEGKWEKLFKVASWIYDKTTKCHAKFYKHELHIENRMLCLHAFMLHSKFNFYDNEMANKFDLMLKNFFNVSAIFTWRHNFLPLIYLHSICIKWSILCSMVCNMHIENMFHIIIIHFFYFTTSLRNNYYSGFFAFLPHWFHN